MDHRCRRGEHCADHEKVDDNRIGRRIEKPDGFCDTCTRQIERTIVELPIDYVTLNTILGKGATVGGEPVRMTKELPVPIRLHIEALQRAMVHEVDLWAASVAAARRIRWNPPGGVRPGWRLDRACTLLAASLDTFLGLRDEKHTVWEYGHRYAIARDGLDGALTMLRLHHRARVFLGATKLVHQLPVPCPRCEAMALEREDGSDLIVCRDCNKPYTWDEYERLCLILVDRQEKGLNVA
jgi:hypothetical protein